jgi:hypothetical protein
LITVGFQLDDETLSQELNIMNPKTDIFSDLISVLIVFGVIGATLLILKAATSLRLIKAKE